MPLTKDQQGALQFLKDFVNSKEPAAVLYGAAGTGKTYVLKHFLNEYKKAVAVTAPTHAAVRNAERMTGKKGLTVHSLHGLRLNVDIANFNIDNMQFDPLAEPKLPNYSLIIEDECSMVNNGLYQLDIQRAKQFGVKILYVGDALQLPPIDETISKTFHTKLRYELREIIRQENGHPLGDVLMLSRSDIENNKTDAITYLIKNASRIINNKGYYKVISSDFDNTIRKYFSTRSVDEISGTKILAFRNDTVDYYNHLSRMSRFKGVNDLIVKDEYLIGYKTIFDRLMNPLIINSIPYLVTDVEHDMCDYEFHTYRVNMIDLMFNKIVPPIEIVDHKSSTYNNFLDILNQFYQNALIAPRQERSRAWKQYFEFKNRFMSMVNITHFNGKTINKDLSYGYAMTIHKAQGSTFKNTFVCMDDVLSMRDVMNGGDFILPTKKEDRIFKNKLLYVALSRTQNIAVIKFNF